MSSNDVRGHVRLSRRRLLGYASGLAAGGVAAGAAWALWPGRDPAAADAPAELRVATGPEGAVYRKVGAGLIQVLAARFPHTRVREITTDASVENLAKLASGDTELAFATLDSADAAMKAGRPADTTAVTRLYDGWVQLFVTAESPVTELAHLHGRRVAAGAPGSGTRFTLHRLLEVIGIRPVLVDASQAAGAAMLAAGQVDAMCTVTGVPTPAVTSLAETRRLRMLELGDRIVDEMQDRFGEIYTPAVLPSSAYVGVATTPTLTSPNLLLARPDLPASVVHVVAEAVFAGQARIAQGHPEANRINVRTGIATGPVRLHPGAESYFRSLKS